MKLKLIDILSYNVNKNLEIEQNLFKHVDNETYIARFWINAPSIILGRFQKKEYEVNQPFIKKHKIEIFRRHTGGGTVYHDLGTLNFSLVKKQYPMLKSNIKDGQTITSIIKEALENNTHSFYQNERNALFYQDKKFLGSAIAISKGIFHYHASILVNTDLNKLNGSINWDPIYDKNDKTFVKSVRSKVINLTHISTDFNLEKSKDLILNKIKMELNISNNS